MFRKISNAVLERRQPEPSTTSGERKAPDPGKQKAAPGATPPPQLAGLETRSPRKSAEQTRESPSDWGAQTLKALDGVAQRGATPGSERTTGFTVRKSPTPRSNASLASLKSKSRPASITDKTSEVETSEPRHVPAVVAATLHETETETTSVTKTDKTAKAAETAAAPATGDHVARLGRVFDTFFGEAVDLDTPSVKPSANKDKHAPVVADVPQAARDAQLEATRSPNARFEAALAGQDMQPIRNGGRGNNCSIYSLVQCAKPDLDGPALDQAVSEIRTDFDAQHPDEKGRMLLLDTNAGGHGAALVSLVNEKFGVDMQVGVVQAGVEDAHPVTTIGQFHGSQRQAGQAPTHRVVVWDQHGHFEAITSTSDKAAAGETDATTLKPQPGSTAPLAAPVTTKPPGELAPSKSGETPPDKQADGTTQTGKQDAAPRPHGEALGQLVPNATVGAKALRRFGRWIRVDNENALPQLLNKTKPEGGIVQGLTKAHLTSSPASALALAHEGVNTVYAAQELGTSAMRKSRYQKQLGNWPASADDPKIKTGGREVPLSEIAGKTDFQSRYDLKVAILGQSEGPQREKMLDVLTGRYIAEVQGKNRVVRSAIRTTMSAVGIGAGVGLAVGTHGAASAAIAGGAILSGRDLLDNRKAAHSLKQHYRDKKMAAIADGAMRNRLEKQLDGEPDATEKEAWDGIRDTVNQQRIGRLLPIKFDRFNENKSTDNKKQEVDLVKKHAAARVVGMLEESHGRHSLAPAYLEASNGVRHKELKKFYRKAVDEDRRSDGGSDIASALQLMRDLGMSKMEAIAHLRTAAGGVAQKPLDEDQAKQMKNDPDPVVRHMAQSPTDRLESALGSAMGRR
ncbi:hypothetical protein DIE03_03680 [Burkholderia sp. Bp8992]|uniref:hypothetical protein n=1 Tax=Burkholderia sp. Bp8992 TaxID=2184554 RepID=UPI000F57EF1F|nr:hypothetical protein [Burkholderia sp. Bp8992]RQS36264.1 hypothetical protein DIE03_03680 [Burkholderia sp. Bp8992]